LSANIFAKIGVGASVLFGLALVGKLAWGLGLLACYGLWKGRGPIKAVLKQQGII
jgi:hypothetical protein